MTKAELEKKLARLQSIQDHLESELSYVDELLRAVGFSNGLVTAKEVALEILQQAEKENPIESEG